MIRTLLTALACLCLLAVQAQHPEGPVMDYAFPSEYEIGGITVSGTEYTDPNAVKLFSGLQVGQKITVPGDFAFTSRMAR